MFATCFLDLGFLKSTKLRQLYAVKLFQEKAKVTSVMSPTYCERQLSDLHYGAIDNVREERRMHVSGSYELVA